MTNRDITEKLGSCLPTDTLREVFSFLDEDDTVKAVFAGVSGAHAKLCLSSGTLVELEGILPKLVGVNSVEMDVKDGDESEYTSSSVVLKNHYCLQDFVSTLKP